MHPTKVTLYDHSYETLAVQYVSANLKKHGWRTSVFYDCSMNKDYLGQDFFLMSMFSLSPEKIVNAILETGPDVVGFSVLTVYYPELAKIMRLLKARRPGIVIICGGPHCILAPEHILENPDVDFIFRGDSDISLPEFLEVFETHTIDEIKRFPVERLPGMANMLDGKVVDRGLGPVMLNLDDVPFPDKEAYYRKNPALRILYTTSTSRGCIFKCTYCNSNNLREIYRESGMQYYRVRSVAHVMEELRFAKKTYHPKYVMFLDNLFAPKTSWLREFSAAYKSEIGLPFFCETNPNVHTRETMELLAEAGCGLLQFGFQSASADVRKNVLHRNETNERIRELVLYAKELGMFVCIDHIGNLPGEKKEHLDEAVALYREIRPNWINLGFIQYYPRAEIVEIALERNALAREDVPKILRGEHQTSFRLLSKTNLGSYYRTLAMRFFCAIKLPPRLGDRLIKLMDKPLFERFFSKFGSIFIYFSRIINAYTDRRDFLVRHHVIRNLYVLKIVAGEKLFKYGRHTEHN